MKKLSAAIVNVTGVKPLLAGCIKVTVEGSSYVVKQNRMGTCWWDASKSGGANQNTVSVCALAAITNKEKMTSVYLIFAIK